MRHGDLWVLLFFLGALVFNWPLLSVFANRQPYVLFILWGLFIAAVAGLSYLSGRERGR